MKNIKPKYANGTLVENYDNIPTFEKLKGINIPGCYCENCGQTFALYSYSSIKPTKIDENKKFYYDFCHLCLPIQ